MSDAPTVLSLFTGAGGFDLGLQEAGFRIAGCVENESDARSTIEMSTDWPLINRPEHEPGNILDLNPSSILEAFELRTGEISLLAGGPPCQPFSKAGLWAAGSTQRMLDPRAATLRSFFAVLGAALPETMLLENVRGLTFAPREDETREEAIDVLAARLDEINAREGTNYLPQFITLNAAHYGVPQRRERVFVFASRDGQQLDVPTASHGSGFDNGQQRFTSCWDAIADLDDSTNDDFLLPTGRWAPLIATVPEGKNYLWHTPRGGGEPLFGWRTKYWSFLLKLAKDQPSWTLQARPGPATGPFHWDNRRLSVREMARLQTFPDSHHMAGSYASATRQLGNAVPAALGELLGLEIRRQFHGRQVRRRLRLVPNLRADCPKACPTAAVPDEFLLMRQEYPDHPGTGKGPEAERRTANGNETSIATSA